MECDKAFVNSGQSGIPSVMERDGGRPLIVTKTVTRGHPPWHSHLHRNTERTGSETGSEKKQS